MIKEMDTDFHCGLKNSRGGVSRDEWNDTLTTTEAYSRRPKNKRTLEPVSPKWCNVI